MTLTRKTPLKAKTPLRRTPMQKGRRKRSKAVQKESRFRSPTYLAFVRQLPCCVCGAPADSAHHLTGMFNVSGMGLKAPDSLAMPVCDGPGDTCHRRIHDDKFLRWQQPIFVVDTINLGLKRFTEGRIHYALQEALEFVREKTS